MLNSRECAGWYGIICHAECMEEDFRALRALRALRACDITLWPWLDRQLEMLWLVFRNSAGRQARFLPVPDHRQPVCSAEIKLSLPARP